MNPPRSERSGEITACCGGFAGTDLAEWRHHGNAAIGTSIGHVELDQHTLGSRASWCVGQAATAALATCAGKAGLGGICIHKVGAAHHNLAAVLHGVTNVKRTIEGVWAELFGIVCVGIKA